MHKIIEFIKWRLDEIPRWEVAEYFADNHQPLNEDDLKKHVENFGIELSDRNIRFHARTKIGHYFYDWLMWWKDSDFKYFERELYDYKKPSV